MCPRDVLLYKGSFPSTQTRRQRGPAGSISTLAISARCSVTLRCACRSANCLLACWLAGRCMRRSALGPLGVGSSRNYSKCSRGSSRAQQTRSRVPGLMRTARALNRTQRAERTQSFESTDDTDGGLGSCERFIIVACSREAQNGGSTEAQSPWARGWRARGLF